MAVCNWVENEMGNINTGDKRLDKRIMRVTETVMNKPDMSFTQQFQSTAELKACYRLFDSDLISSEIILEPHFANKIALKRIQWL